MCSEHRLAYPNFSKYFPVNLSVKFKCFRLQATLTWLTFCSSEALFQISPFLDMVNPVLGKFVLDVDSGLRSS